MREWCCVAVALQGVDVEAFVIVADHVGSSLEVETGEEAPGTTVDRLSVQIYSVPVSVVRQRVLVVLIVTSCNIKQLF